MTVLTDAERRALDAVDVPAAVEMLSRLIGVPSITGSPAESELQHLLAPRLEELGADVDLWSLDLGALRAAPGFPGTEAPRDEGWGLVGTWPTDDGDPKDGRRTGVPALILQGHVDVVPPGDLAQWPGDPFTARREADVVHGRGACDMKAGVAANLAAVGAIRTAGIRLRRPLAVHLVVGEEDGGLGAFAALARGHTGDACVITEPTGGTLVTANAGALTFRLTVPGAATHGSTRYAGVSAIDCYWVLHAALETFEGERNRHVDPLMQEYPIAYPLSVGTIHGGDWASSVPDRLVAEGRLGVRLDEEPAQARAAFETRVREVCDGHPWLREHPADVRWSGGQFASGRTPVAHPLGGTVGQAHRDVTGTFPRERGAPYGSDLRLYAAAGVPTLHYGPGDVRVAHGPREQVSLRDLADVTRTLVLTVLRSCGVT